MTRGIVPPQLWVPGSVRQGGLKRTKGRTCGWVWGHRAAHSSCQDLGKTPCRPPRPLPTYRVQTPPWRASPRRPWLLFSCLVLFIQSPSWPCRLPPSQRSTRVVSGCVLGAMCRARTRSGEQSGGTGQRGAQLGRRSYRPSAPPSEGGSVRTLASLSKWPDGCTPSLDPVSPPPGPETPALQSRPPAAQNDLVCREGSRAQGWDRAGDGP